MKYLIVILSFFIFSRLHAQDTTFRKPVIVSKEITRVALGDTYHYAIQAMDSSSRPVSFSIKQLPTWLSYNETTHTISGKAVKVGQYPITITVSNLHKKTAHHFILTVYNQQTNNILCLGNSLTNGTNKYNSYRRDLWQILHKANYNFDFIGSWNKHHGGGAVPDDDFDTDHDGHSGWTIDNMFNPPDWDSIRGNINKWLTEYKPDIVLIELGTNDVFQCVKVADMITKLDQLVQTLRKKNSMAKIFIAQIPPLGQQWAPKKLCGDSIAYETVIKDLNKQIRLYSQMANKKTSPVRAVDQFTGVNPATDMYDDIHPNDSGEKIMAKRWFDAIHGYIKKLP